jgi:hypothetical protein
MARVAPEKTDFPTRSATSLFSRALAEKQMSNKTYFEKLRDPRWQKKRLEAMESKDFTCELCGDSKSTLNVHHKTYLKGREPWEYSIDQLSVLCESCHKQHHSQESFIKVITSFVNPEDEYEVGSLMAGYMGLDPEIPIFYKEEVGQDDFPTTPSSDYEHYQIGVLAKYFYNTFNPNIVEYLIELKEADKEELSNLIHSFVLQNR